MAGNETDSKEAKQDKFLTQVVTLNQQDEVIPFNEGNLEDDAGEEDCDKDWNNGDVIGLANVLEGDVLKEEVNHDGGDAGLSNSLSDVQKLDSEASRAGRRRAFGNALKKISQTSEKGQVAKIELRQKMDSKPPLLTYQPGRKRKKTVDRSADTDQAPTDGANGTISILGKGGLEESAGLHAETSEAQRRIKHRVGRPSKASQQSPLGVDSKFPGMQVKPNTGENKVDSDNGVGEDAHEASDRTITDDECGTKLVSSENGHNKRGAHLKKVKHSFDVKEEGEAGEGHETTLDRDIAVKSEGDKTKKGPKKDRIQSSSKASEVSSSILLVCVNLVI